MTSECFPWNERDEGAYIFLRAPVRYLDAPCGVDVQRPVPGVRTLWVVRGGLDGVAMPFKSEAAALAEARDRMTRLLAYFVERQLA